MNQGSSNKIWYIIGLLVIIALAFWFSSSSPAKAPTTNQVSRDNTTAAISSDLSQTSDGSAELDQAAAASAQSVQGF